MSTRVTGRISRRQALSAPARYVLFLAALLLSAAGYMSASASASVQSGSAPTTPRADNAAHTLALLPGDAVIGPAALDQESPQIAAGAGGYLVVWEDSRANHASFPGNAVPPNGQISGQTLKDIFAVRLDATLSCEIGRPILYGISSAEQERLASSVRGLRLKEL